MSDNSDHTPEGKRGETHETPQRIQKILSAHGVASRRDSEKLVLEGRITVNGEPVSIGQKAQFGLDVIAVDGVPITQRNELVYIMLNKPIGYVTTMRDDRGRKIVTDLVNDAGIKVYPVGRLDMYTGGLLLMTNDGQFANAVAHPSYNKSKTYEARVRGDVVRGAALLRRPIEVDSHMVHAVSVTLTERTAEGGILHIKINEGRNRQLRKMCIQCGLKLLSLKRISIASLELGTLKTGEWRYLTVEERRSLFEDK